MRLFDVIEEREFYECNSIFVVLILKKLGLAQVKHYPAISDEDLDKLYYGSDVLSFENPFLCNVKFF